MADTRALVEHEQGFDCGWWPPGEGEPGQEWTFEPGVLGLDYEPRDEVIAIHLMTPDGPRALVAIPIIALFRVLAEHFDVERSGSPAAGETP